MALENLEPAVRVEAILDGADIQPANRIEYFMQKAANEVPKAAAVNTGKVLTSTVDANNKPVITWEAPSGGGTSSLLILHVDADGVLDKTFNEIYTAALAGVVPFIVNTNRENMVTFMMCTGIVISTEPELSYRLVFMDDEAVVFYDAANANAYPVEGPITPK